MAKSRSPLAALLASRILTPYQCSDGVKFSAGKRGHIRITPAGLLNASQDVARAPMVMPPISAPGTGAANTMTWTAGQVLNGVGAAKVGHYLGWHFRFGFGADVSPGVVSLALGVGAMLTTDEQKFCFWDGERMNPTEETYSFHVAPDQGKREASVVILATKEVSSALYLKTARLAGTDFGNGAVNQLDTEVFPTTILADAPTITFTAPLNMNVTCTMLTADSTELADFMAKLGDAIAVED